MSNVVHRFTLGGLDDTDLGIQLLAGYDEPIAPDTREKRVQIPGRHGEYDFGADLSVRLFRLKGEFVDATTRGELQEAARALADHLVDDDGEPRELALSFDKEPDKAYTVRYTGGLDIERIVSHGTFTLELIACDPFAYGEEMMVEEKIVSVITEIGLVNGGTVSTLPVITIRNNGENTIFGFSLELD